MELFVIGFIALMHYLGDWMRGDPPQRKPTLSLREQAAPEQTEQERLLEENQHMKIQLGLDPNRRILLQSEEEKEEPERIFVRYVGIVQVAAPPKDFRGIRYAQASPPGPNDEKAE